MVGTTGATASRTRDDRQQLVLLIGFALAYVGAFFFSDQFTRDAQGMPALWPVNAIAAVALLRLSPRYQAAFWMISLTTRLISHRLAGDPWAVVLIYTGADSVEVLLASMITRKVTRGRVAIRSVGQALGLIAAVLPLTTVMAAVGASLVCLVTNEPFLGFFASWAICTSLGMAITLPAALVITEPDRFATYRRPPAIQAGLYLLVAGVTATAFFGPRQPMPFMIFPAAMLAAFQLGPKGAGWSAAVVVAVAAPMSVAGFGDHTITPGWSDPDRIRLVQAFVTAMFLTCLAASLSLYREHRLKVLMARRSAVARAARARAQAASQAKSEFLATMSHEIRTPLNSILGFADLLGATEPLTPEGRHKLDLVAGAGQSLVTLVNDILDFSRLEAGGIQLDLHPVSPAALLRETAAIVAPDAQAKGLTLVVETEAPIETNDTAFYALDESRLRQVLLNLLNNAVKFTPEGRITARLAVARGDGDGADTLRFEIADTGIGVSPEQQSRLFQRFSQADGSISRSFGGAGLGLAICKALVGLMGGEIGLDSALGQGARFWFALPAARAQAPVAVEVEAQRETAARVLLVDDHPMNRELGEALLVLAGCEVTVAEDGDEAVRLASEHDFDVILMDIHMPRMDGLAATRAIRALAGARGLAPIIALTADVMPQQIERCRRAGMVDHIAKPIDRETLYRVVDHWLSRDRAAA
jgi:signal transduction histidine kinase/ActR/RegA family two-component response regulator